MQLMPFTQWMAKYRPSGKGRITITTWGNGQVPTHQHIDVPEVVCDGCNALITPTDKNGKETIVHDIENQGAYCEPCGKGYMK